MTALESVVKRYRDKLQDTLDALEKAEDSAKTELRRVAGSLLREKAEKEARDIEENLGSLIADMIGLFVTPHLPIDATTKHEILSRIAQSREERESRPSSLKSKAELRKQEMESLSAKALYHLINRLSSEEPMEKILEAPW